MKNFGFFSKCSKKLFFVKKLNDGFIQTCDMWFDNSMMFTGWEIKIQKFFIYHIFSKPRGSLKSQKNSAGQIRWNFKLKRSKFHVRAGFWLHNVPSEFQLAAPFSHKKALINFRETYCIFYPGSLIRSKAINASKIGKHFWHKGLFSAAGLLGGAASLIAVGSSLFWRGSG